MKNTYKALFLGLFTFVVSHGFSNTTGGSNKPTPKNNDSIVNFNSNIVIFKMIATPPPSNSNSGSLKKAGKVARTSNSHPLTYSLPIHYVKPIS